jgi:aspartyl-tRNA(Asn)/glutamyl-tRNA(Gln) amidotransferase subunit A
MKMETIKLNVKQMQEKFQDKTLTSKEAVDEFYRQIDKLNPKLHAFLELWKESALKRAEESDERIAAGTARALEGVPIAVKDNFMVNGKIMSSSSKYLENYISPYDATVITRLKEAGAVFLGRTNMDEFAMGGSTETSAFGPSKNPYDPTRIPGGSSGGSAVAVAADMAPCALGSDTGGSIRQPAGFCNLVGYKPSYGLISRYGICALASSFDQVGTFTRTVWDMAKLVSVMSGKDMHDPVCEPNDYIDYTKGLDDVSVLKGLKVGVPKELSNYEIDPEIKESFNASLEKLKKAGAKIIDISVEAYQYVPSLYKVIMCAEVGANIATFDGIRYGYRTEQANGLNDEYARTRAESLGYEVKKRIIFGTYVLGAKNYYRCYHQAQRVRTLLINELNAAFEKCDVIFTPASLQMPAKFGQKLREESDIFMMAANLAGLPGVTMPSEVKKNALPIGVHFLGKRLEDAKLFKYVGAFEKATDARSGKNGI